MAKSVKIIVEISGNHQNNYRSLKKLVNQAIRNGADIIKFQVYKPETITFKSNSKDFKIEKQSKWSDYSNLFELYPPRLQSSIKFKISLCN